LSAGLFDIAALGGVSINEMVTVVLGAVFSEVRGIGFGSLNSGVRFFLQRNKWAVFKQRIVVYCVSRGCAAVSSVGLGYRKGRSSFRKELIKQR